MEYRSLGEDMPAPARIVLGTMIFGLDRADEWFRLLDEYRAIGGNCLDTGRIYWGGESERVIGEWLKRRGIRDEFLIITKGAHPKPDGIPRVTPSAIEDDLAKSLDALGVDSIDLYLLHRDDPDVPVGEIVDCLDEQLRSGQIKRYGGSNWTAGRIEEANAYAKKHGKSGFTLSSPNLSLAVPNEPRWRGCVSLSTDDLAWYERTQMPVFSWSSQAGGFFTGAFHPEKRDDADMVRVYYSDENWARLERARALAKEKGVEATHIALAYVLSQGFPTFALIGPKSIEELKVSTEQAELRLTPEEVRWLDGRVTSRSA